MLASVRAHGGTPRLIGASYGGKTLIDFCHGWAYFHLMGRLGATSMSVLKAVVAAASFFSSVAFFCNQRCCVAREQAAGEVCPAAPAPRPPRGAPPSTAAPPGRRLWLGAPPRRSSFFCHYSAAQCFTPMKALSLFLVLSGVLLYTASSRTRLTRPAQEVEDSDDDDDLDDISLEEIQADVCIVSSPKREEAVDFGGGGRRGSNASTPSPHLAAADEPEAEGAGAGAAPTMSVWRAATSRWMSR